MEGHKLLSRLFSSNLPGMLNEIRKYGHFSLIVPETLQDFCSLFRLKNQIWKGLQLILRKSKDVFCYSEFLAAKLSSDSIQVIPAVLECCVKLLSHAVQTFALKDLVRVLKAAVDELYVQSFTQSTRLMAYRLCILGISSLSDEGAVYANDQDEAIRLLGGAEHSILQVIRMVNESEFNFSCDGEC